MPASGKPESAARIAAILAAVFAAVFFLTLLTPMAADDFNYAFSWADGQRVRNLRDVARSMSCHRNYTNGRVFAHGMVQLFSFLPSWLFALCNALVCTGGAFLLHRLLRDAGGRGRPGLLLSTLALLWIAMPVFGQIFFWRDGACNYSWGLFLALALLQPFCRAWLGKALPGRRLPLLLPAAFLAGAWSEHISFSMLAACFLLWAALWIRRRRFPLALFLLLVGGGLGYLYLMLAPSMLGGTQSHRGTLSAEAVLTALHHLDELLAAAPGGRPAVIVAGGLVLAALLFGGVRLGWRKTLGLAAAALSLGCLLGAGILGFRSFRAEGVYGLLCSSELGLALAGCGFFLPLSLALLQGAAREKLLLAGLLFLGGLCSLPLFMFASYFPARGAAAPVLFSVLSGALLLGEGKTGRGMKTAFLCLMLVFALSFSLGTADILAVHRSELRRQEQIRLAQQGDGIAVVSIHPVRSKYSAQYGLDDLTESGEWPNDVMAQYYGIDRICLG